MAKLYTIKGLVGCVVQRRNRQTGTLISIYHNGQAKFDDMGGAWSTLCEEHGSICAHATLALARHFGGRPGVWCENCRKLTEGNGD